MPTKNDDRIIMTQDDLDKLRGDFADRLNMLIGDSEKEKNLENFSRKSGIPLRMLSQWRNKRHLNWPNIGNLIRIAKAANVSIDWLLLGPSAVSKRKTG